MATRTEQADARNSFQTRVIRSAFGHDNQMMNTRPHSKPAVYLLVILPIMVGGAVSLVIALLNAYTRITGVETSAVPRINTILIMFPALFVWIPASLLLSNVVLHAVPPFRRMAEAYVTQTAQPVFEDSQRMLLKVLAALSALCLPLIALGFAL